MVKIFLQIITAITVTVVNCVLVHFVLQYLRVMYSSNERYYLNKCAMCPFLVKLQLHLFFNVVVSRRHFFLRVLLFRTIRSCSKQNDCKAFDVGGGGGMVTVYCCYKRK